MKYKVGDLIYYYDNYDGDGEVNYDGDGEVCESSVGTIIDYRMEKRFPNDPDGSEVIHYKVLWSDGWTDNVGDYLPEDVVDEYSDALNEALGEK